MSIAPNHTNIIQLNIAKLCQKTSFDDKDTNALLYLLNLDIKMTCNIFAKTIYKKATICKNYQKFPYESYLSFFEMTCKKYGEIDRHNILLMIGCSGLMKDIIQTITSFVPSANYIMSTFINTMQNIDDAFKCDRVKGFFYGHLHNIFEAPFVIDYIKNIEEHKEIEGITNVARIIGYENYKQTFYKFFGKYHRQNIGKKILLCIRILEKAPIFAITVLDRANNI